MAKSNTLENTILDDLFPRKLSKSDQRRLETLNGAIKAYSELDYTNVSFDQIAVPSKLSRRLVQHYFPDKDVLFETTMRLVRAKFQKLAVDALKTGATPRLQFEEYIKSTFYWIKKEPLDVRAWFLFFLVCSQKPKFRKTHNELARMGETRIRALIDQMGIQKKMPEATAHYLAKSIQRLITGGIIEACSEAEPADLGVIQDQVLQACLALLKPYLKP